MGRESHIRTVAQNFTFVALKMWDYSSHKTPKLLIFLFAINTSQNGKVN